MRACQPKDVKRRERGREKERRSTFMEEERERPPALWLLFLYVFPSPLGLPSVNWASQEGCLFYLRSSLWSSDLPLFYFHGFFPSLSFSHCHSGLHNSFLPPFIISHISEMCS